MRVIIGAGKTAFEGWVSTQESELNLFQEEDFRRLFAQERPEAMLAEHVWEHMTFEEGCRELSTATNGCRMGVIFASLFLMPISVTNGIRIW